MKDIIQRELQEYEVEYDISIIGARDYGSRSKGLQGPSSDYDVFFLFLEPYEEYVAGNERETITRESQEENIEYHGWNLRKFRTELAGNGPNAISYIQSDVVYYEKNCLYGPFRDLESHIRHNFKPVALIEHYRSMAANNYHKYLEKTVHNGEGESLPVIGENENYYVVEKSDGGERMIRKDSNVFELGTRDLVVKRNLMVMDALLRAKYVEETHDLPPRDFFDLLEECENLDCVDADICMRAEHLAELKTEGEGQKECGNQIKDFAEAELGRDIDHATHVVDGIDRDELDHFVSYVCREASP